MLPTPGQTCPVGWDKKSRLMPTRYSLAGPWRGGHKPFPSPLCGCSGDDLSSAIVADPAGHRQESNRRSMFVARLAKLIQMIECLHAGVGLSTRGLAERLGISKRTVYRDLRLLRRTASLHTTTMRLAT